MPSAAHLGDLEITSTMGGVESVSLMLTVCSLVSMVTVLTMCTCCKRKVKNGDAEDAYCRVSNDATMESGQITSPGNVQFRPSTKLVISDRHSQPSNKSTGNAGGPGQSSRASAPSQTGRALPQLPADLYSAIEKPRKDSRGGKFGEDGVNPTYESIDAENDSVVDPLYSKVGELAAVVRKERKYDYPVFTGKKNTDTQGTSQEDAVYQSASQVYAAGSEDPYSSITSDSRQAGGNSGDGDSSSVYDPGYAKVKLPNEASESKRQDRLARTERELDQLYSKIRRNSRDRGSESPPPGPSRVTMEELLDEEPPVVAVREPTLPVDGESVTSREPSYRYITVRENADIVRERLRQQGQLGPPIREHYYSTIENGNEYETVGDTASSTYSGVQQNVPVSQAMSARNIEDVSSGLSVNTATPTSGVVVAPPPPTSPIPDRSPFQKTEPMTSSNKSVEAPVGGDSSQDVDHSQLPSSPYRSRFGQRPTSMDTYAVVNKPMKESSSSPQRGTSDGTMGTTTVETGRESRPRERMHAFNPSMQPSVDWNAPSRAHATSFAGLHRSLSREGTEQVLGRRVTEEREVIVEHRSSSVSGSRDPAFGAADQLAASQFHGDGDTSQRGSEKVHHVEIKRMNETVLPLVAHATADDIISGRRYRGINGSLYGLEDQSRSREILNAAPNVPSLIGVPGPSSPMKDDAGTSTDNSPLKENRDDLTSRSSRATGRSSSGLPIPLNDGEVRKMTEKSRQRSIEREEQERSQSQREEEQRRLRDVSTSNRKDGSRERRGKTWRTETEDEKVARLGTIYTANDYVSPIDMTTQRPWPFCGNTGGGASTTSAYGSTGPSSPPGLRKSSRVEEETTTDRSRERDSELVMLREGGGGSCSDLACFCHSNSARDSVERSNRQEMRKISFDGVLELDG